MSPTRTFRQTVIRSGDSWNSVWPLEYNLVCCTGDFVETSAGWDSAGDALTQLDAPFGVFATLGAHDYCPPVRTLDEWLSFNIDRLTGSPRRFVNPQPFVDRLESSGIVVLRNEWRSLEIGGELVRIGGAGDDSVGMAHLGSAVPPAGGFSMLLTHSPDAALRLPSRAEGGPSVVLSGHTHGGQIRVPGWGAPGAPFTVGESRAAGRRLRSGRRAGSRQPRIRYGSFAAEVRLPTRDRPAPFELRSPLTIKSAGLTGAKSGSCDVH